MEAEVYGIIYGILNVINGKFYIGSTTRPDKRLKEHLRELNNGKHHSQPLQRAWTKYGSDSFIFLQLQEAYDEVELATLEMIYTEEYQAMTDGYVLVAGRDHITEISEETKQKMSETRKGKPKSEETRRKMSQANRGENNYWYGKTGELNPFYGRKHSPESIKRMSEVKKGESNAMYGRTGDQHHLYGKKHSLETLQKMSEAHKGKNNGMYGRKHSPETIERMRRPKSEEHKRKLSEAAKAQWKRQKGENDKHEYSN